MARSVALGSGIVGAVVAAAVIVGVGATVGLGASEEPSADGAALASLGVLSDVSSEASNGLALSGAASLASLVEAGAVTSEVVTTTSGEQVEYVYVDAPAGDDDDDDRYEDDEDHDDDHEEREADDRRHEEREHEDGDDD